jgi:hypothetical protein
MHTGLNLPVLHASTRLDYLPLPRASCRGIVEKEGYLRSGSAMKTGRSPTPRRHTAASEHGLHFSPRLCGAVALFGCLHGCDTTWNVRPAAPSRVKSVDGLRDRYRACIETRSQRLQTAELKTATESIPGIVDPRPASDACAYFVGPAAARALDGEATLVVKAEGTDAAELIPLTSPGARFVPSTRFDAEARLAYAQPLSDGYGGLLQLHNAIFYRLSPVRIGAVFEARMNLHTALLGTGLVTNVDLTLSDRWFFELEGSYSLGIAPYGKAKWDGQWYHGPGAILSLGHTPRKFLGAPPPADRSALGPAVAMEYLRLPRQEEGIFVLSAGLFVRYGL